MASTKIMVELSSGYGDGYGIVEAADGAPVVEAGSKATRYADTAIRIEAWKRTILSAPLIDLIDGGVRVPPGAVRRIIGPLDCPEAVRIRARRYAKNWTDSRFVELAGDEELAAAMSHASERDTYAACQALQRRYAAG